MVANKLLKKGCFGYLAVVIGTSISHGSLEQISVVCEYPDIFLEEFPGLPLNREIEFCIDLLPDTQPISIPSYQMAPAELKELKGQLKDLLDKGFIHSSCSP